jgi:DNA-binding transcriptional LysR family regulator
MELSQLEAFVTISQFQGFSRAASVLHLSQPAISRRISLLEQELGVTLFERVHGGVLLTKAGETFLPYAHRALAATHDGVEALQRLAQQEQGTIQLALVGTLASTDLTVRFLHFRQTYPQFRLILRTARSKDVSAMVQSGEVHLGLRYFADPNPDIVSQIVAQESLVVVCSPQHPFETQLPLEAHDLAGMPWVSFPTGVGDSGEPFTQVLERQLMLAGLATAELVAIDSLTAQKRLIEADFGFGLLPLSSIQEELQLGTLRILDIKALQASVPVMVIYRQNGYLSSAAQRLLQLFVEEKPSAFQALQT